MKRIQWSEYEGYRFLDGWVNNEKWFVILLEGSSHVVYFDHVPVARAVSLDHAKLFCEALASERLTSAENT